MNKKELSKYYHLSMEINELEEQIKELMDSLARRIATLETELNAKKLYKL